MANFNLTTIKRLIKRPTKRLLQTFAANFGRHTRKPKQPELLILMYHRILPADDPRALIEEPGMMVTPETFRLHMSLIKPLFETIHLSQWLELKTSGKTLPERACVVSFDDGWADNHEFAFPILKEFDIPATIFLVSDMIGTNNSFWPERLSRVLNQIATQTRQWSHQSLNWITQLPVTYTFSENNTVQPDQEQLSEIIAAVKSISDDELHRRIDLIDELLEQPLNFDSHTQQPDLLSWQQIEEMYQSNIIEIGSHTCNHTRLTDDKTKDVLRHEIADSKQTIFDRTGNMVTTFCYPNGDYSDAAKELVGQHYAGAVTTKSGWNTADSNTYLLQRVGVHEDISNNRISFLARLSGWM